MTVAAGSAAMLSGASPSNAAVGRAGAAAGAGVVVDGTTIGAGSGNDGGGATASVGDEDARLAQTRSISAVAWMSAAMPTPPVTRPNTNGSHGGNRRRRRRGAAMRTA